MVLKKLARKFRRKGSAHPSGITQQKRAESLAWIFKPTSLFAGLLLLTPVVAHSWGPIGHRVINRAAINALPNDGPTFLKKYVEYISDQSTIPDTWRADEPFSRMEEDPNHVWFRERLTYLKPVPRSRYELVLDIYKHYETIKTTDSATAVRTNVRWSGTLPYAAMEAYGDLVEDFRIYRKLKATGQDTHYVEQTCAFLAVRLAHYLGDASQPLHDSIHVGGWQGPNPHGYTTDTAIHGRFEGTMVRGMKLTDRDLAPKMGAPGHLTGDMFENVLAYIDESASRVESIYQLDKRGAFAGDFQDPAGREMVITCTANGARMLRDMLYRAWLESGLKVESEKPAPPQPTNPRYNPETGSAPAAMSPSLDGPKASFGPQQ
jgi:hypothetical protein